MENKLKELVEEGERDIQKQAQVIVEATSQYSSSNNQDHKQAEINIPATPLQFSEIIQIIPVQDLISEPENQNQSPVSSGDVHIKIDSVTGESPPKSKITADWTILITTLVIEGVSAVLDQLNYLLPSMVLAFVALLVSAVELIYIAQKEGLIKMERERRCMPCYYYCHWINDNSPTSELFIIVNGFGFTSALWQCLYSTFQYIYGHRHLNNPIKMTLLPFLFFLCVLISKSTRLRRKMEDINCQDFNRSRAKMQPQSRPNQSGEACLSLMEQREAVDANVSVIILEFGAGDNENDGGKACIREDSEEDQ